METCRLANTIHGWCINGLNKFSWEVSMCTVQPTVRSIRSVQPYTCVASMTLLSLSAVVPLNCCRWWCVLAPSLRHLRSMHCIKMRHVPNSKKDTSAAALLAL